MRPGRRERSALSIVVHEDILKPAMIILVFSSGSCSTLRRGSGSYRGDVCLLPHLLLRHGALGRHQDHEEAEARQRGEESPGGNCCQVFNPSPLCLFGTPPFVAQYLVNSHNVFLSKGSTRCWLTTARTAWTSWTRGRSSWSRCRRGSRLSWWGEKGF